MAELRELSEAAAEALLKQIAAEAPRLSGAALESVANAYAAVTGAMPRPRSASPRG